MGKQLDTNTWNQRDLAGTGTFAMVDAVDGGFGITTGTALADNSQIDYNNIRPFAHNASVIILVVQRVGSSSTVQAGFTDDGAHGATRNEAFLIESDSNSFKRLATADGSANSTTDSDVAVDTNWHVYKIVCGSSNVKLYIDGVLKVTKTTNRPSFRLQPFFRVTNNSAGAGREGRIRYIEAYNV